MESLFKDVILRKEIKAKNNQLAINRNTEILKFFGDYCQKYEKELKSLFEHVEINNKKSDSKSEPWFFSIYMYQSRKNFDNGCSIFVHGNRINVISDTCKGYSKEFSFDPLANKTQLAKVIKNALKYAVSKAYKLP